MQTEMRNLQRKIICGGLGFDKGNAEHVTKVYLLLLGLDRNFQRLQVDRALSSSTASHSST